MDIAHIKYIIIGFYNIIKDKLKLLNIKKQKLYNKRLNICLKPCIYFNFKNNKCHICGCNVYAKTKSEYKLDKNGKSIDGCPKKYW